MKRLAQISVESVWMLLLLGVAFLGLSPGTAKATTYHTVTCTGTPSSDFAGDETTTTSTSSVNAYLTWDANNLYVAYDNANNSEPVVIYIDTDPQPTPTSGTGTTGGFNYDGVTPTLPFSANFVAYVKNGYQEYRTWTGSAWSSSTTTGISTDFATNTEEFSIPWSAMGGKPARMYFLIFKDNGNSSSPYIYGQAPVQMSDGSYSAPTFTHWYSDNVTTGISPFAGSDVSLAVQMSSYSAAYTAKGVTLNWRTQSEVDNAGFNILRKSSTEASYSKIASYKTDPALHGLGTSTSGRSYSYTDAAVSPGASYDYKIQEVAASGAVKNFGPIAVQAKSQTPSKYALEQNYPNPFNPATTIRYALPSKSQVTLEVYNTLGQLVRKLVNSEQNAGEHEVVFDGDGLASGVYFYRLSAGSFVKINKMMMIK